jgi:hypothetical protein
VFNKSTKLGQSFFLQKGIKCQLKGTKCWIGANAGSVGKKVTTLLQLPAAGETGIVKARSPVRSKGAPGLRNHPTEVLDRMRLQSPGVQSCEPDDFPRIHIDTVTAFLSRNATRPLSFSPTELRSQTDRMVLQNAVPEATQRSVLGPGKVGSDPHCPS